MLYVQRKMNGPISCESIDPCPLSRCFKGKPSGEQGEQPKNRGFSPVFQLCCWLTSQKSSGFGAFCFPDDLPISAEELAKKKPRAWPSRKSPTFETTLSRSCLRHPTCLPGRTRKNSCFWESQELAPKLLAGGSNNPSFF